MAFLLLRAGQLLLGVAIIGAATPSCYSAGDGTAPPSSTFYFPTGLAVSPDGAVLYAANSDFDLQWNGGTLQSYDLGQLRQDAALLIQANLSGSTTRPPIPFIDPSPWMPNCLANPPAGGASLGQGCAPPIDSKHYFHHSVTIGAFATTAQISIARGTPQRLFIPVGGDEAITWIAIGLGADPNNMTDPFAIFCGQGSDGRCDANHQVGNDPNQAGDTRQVTMPDEPFGIAQTERDGIAIAVTHQTAGAASLVTTGFGVSPPDAGADAGPGADAGTEAGPPAMQFVASGLPVGGSGIAAVPHDPDGPLSPCDRVGYVQPCLLPAFLETNHSTAEIDLLRFYNDDGSSLHRPYIQKETAFPLTSNAIGTDSRGIVIDPTPRIACKAQGGPLATCATQVPARVFFASRTPPALGIGQIGGIPSSGIGTYNPDELVLTGNVPLSPGPSNVYLAPIVNQSGAFELRVFVVLFDSNQIAVYDPSLNLDESAVTYINVGPGPSAMAFDPFSIDAVGKQAMVGSPDTNGNRPYRFAYVANFTQSFVQMIDLDNSQPTSETFERVVFTLGLPTLPKAQQGQQGLLPF